MIKKISIIKKEVPQIAFHIFYDRNEQKKVLPVIKTTERRV